jgi:excisionase family DNA binding protein
VERPDLDDDFLTVAEVAGLLKLNPQTVRNWIDQGTLPALRVGRRVRILRRDYERLLTESYRSGRDAGPAAGPTADDFWGGEVVAPVDPGPGGGA